MLEKKLKYTNFLDEEVERTIYLHLTKTDLTEIVAEHGNVVEMMMEWGKNPEGKGKEIMAFLKLFISRAYGERSADGERFIKTPESGQEFLQTAAFDALMSELFSEEGDPIAFMVGLVPADLGKKVREHVDKADGKPMDFLKKAGE